MNQNAKLHGLESLMRTVVSIRQYLTGAGFQEVIAPVLHSTVPLEPTIYPFTTTWQRMSADTNLYLATSPERYLKMLMAHGVGNCFTIGHSFRNLENTGQTHHPEFLMLEWYRLHASSATIMDDVEQLIAQVVADQSRIKQRHESTSPLIYQGKTIAMDRPFERLSLESLFCDVLGVSIADILTEESLATFAESKGFLMGEATWEQQFNQLFLNLIEPSFSNKPFFLTDFPARISPLCKRQEARPFLADRFELYIAHMEIANGNSEQVDSDELCQSFQAEGRFREIQGGCVPPIDQAFLDSIRSLSEISTAGVGLGVERLAMILADVTDIHALWPVECVER